LILLDVDGVINAYAHGDPPSPWQPRTEEKPVPYDIDRDDIIEIPKDGRIDSYRVRSVTPRLKAGA
jgi:hypothetical protein